MRKIGIMGGTFDPVHNGHLMLADTAYRQFDLDQVWFLPNGNPPHKKEENIGTDARHRSRMVALAIQGRDYCRLEEYEGQEHILAEGKLLYRMIKADRLSSVIFFGPPGTGKTSLTPVVFCTTRAVTAHAA